MIIKLTQHRTDFKRISSWLQARFSFYFVLKVDLFINQRVLNVLKRDFCVEKQLIECQK